MSQILKFAAVVVENLPDLVPEIMQLWIENPKDLKKVLEETLCLQARGRSNYITHFLTIIDKNKNVDVLLRKANITWASQYINSFQIKEVDSQIALFHFNRKLASEDVIAEMNKAGYQPATIWDLFDIAEQHRILLDSFKIVALGTRSREGFVSDMIPFLGYGTNGVFMSQYEFEIEWGADKRFAAVKK